MWLLFKNKKRAKRGRGFKENKALHTVGGQRITTVVMENSVEEPPKKQNRTTI